MKKDLANVTRWKHKFGFHNRGVQWDTPMSRWAGEGTDWVQLMTQGPPRKEDVMISLLKMMRQPTEKKPQKGGGAPKKKPRDLEPVILEMPAEEKKLMLQIRGDSKTIVDWVFGHAKLKTWESAAATVQNLLWDWWGRGRAVDWTVHIFRGTQRRSRLLAWERSERS